MSEIARRIRSVRERIVRAAEAIGRDPASIQLVAVSKGQPIEAIREAMAEGIAEFGENYAQELAAKTVAWGAVSPAPRWHFQGGIQRRKIKEILKVSSSLLSVARVEEIEEIGKRASGKVECWFEVSVAGEVQKNGVEPGGIPDLLEAAAAVPLIEVKGLMAVPPFDCDPAPYFAKLRDLAVAFDLVGVSMGMSSDFEAAIAEGATMVRIGTAIFGERQAR